MARGKFLELGHRGRATCRNLPSIGEKMSCDHQRVASGCCTQCGQPTMGGTRCFRCSIARSRKQRIDARATRRSLVADVAAMQDAQIDRLRAELDARTAKVLAAQRDARRGGDQIVLTGRGVGANQRQGQVCVERLPERITRTLGEGMGLD